MILATKINQFLSCLKCWPLKMDVIIIIIIIGLLLVVGISGTGLDTTLKKDRTSTRMMVWNNTKWSILIEACAEHDDVATAAWKLLEEYNATEFLGTLPCQNPLALSDAVLKATEVGKKRLLVAATSTMTIAMDGWRRQKQPIPKVHFINLDDQLFLYQKTNSKRNLAAFCIHDLLTIWGWNHVHFYLDPYYEDGIGTNVQSSATKKQSTYVVQRLVSTTTMSPRQFVRGLISEEVKHVRSIVVVADHRRTIGLLRMASRANLISRKEQWLLFLKTNLKELSTVLKFQMDSTVYIGDHSGKIRNVKTLIMEYLKQQQPLVNAGASSAFWDNGTLAEWASNNHWMETVINLEIQKLDLDESGKLTFKENYHWNVSNGLASNFLKQNINYQGRSLKVSTFESPPYVIILWDNSGKPSFSGYLVDILEVVASTLNFTIQYVMVENEVPGTSQNSSWNGIVNSLAKKESDIGLLDLTITSDRVRVIDFAEVALDTPSTAGLYRRPGSDGEGMDKFGVYLEPFHLYVWIASIVTLFLLGSSLYGSVWVTKRLAATSGMQWNNDPLDVSRTVLLGFQAIAQQGCELSFETPSSRIIFVVLWFFALIAYSSYSATLMSYLTVSKIYVPFDSLSTLVRNKDYKIGLLQGSSHLEMFQESVAADYAAVWRRVVQSQLKTVVDDYDTGFARAYNEKFVLLSDDKTMQYLTRNTCDLVVSEPLTSSYFVTLAFQKNSPHKKSISRVLTTMSAAGLLYRYHDKWWGTGLICQQETRLFVSLSLTNVATGFLLWLGGIAGGAIALVVEGLVLRCGPKRPLQQKPDPIKHLYKRKFLHFSAT